MTVAGVGPVPESSLLRAALGYAEAGKPVFPCGPNKRPLISRDKGGRGLHDATRDPDQIRRWWAQYPAALIGMPTGPASGLWVLDVDRHGEVRGDLTLSDLEDVHGPLPETVQSITPTGGWHFFFTLPPDGRKVVSRAGQLGRGLDSRGHGGYVILPPSVGAAGAYVWEGSSDPTEGVLPVPAPNWLLDLVCAPLAVPAGVAVPPPSRGLPARTETEGALAVLSADGYDFWVQVGIALHGSGADWGFEVWDAWSARSPKYAGGDALRLKWASFGRHSGSGVSLGTVFASAKEAGWQRPAPVRTEGPMPPQVPLEAYAEEAAASVPKGKPALRVVGGTEFDPRPTVQIVDGALPDMIDAAERHLLAAQAGIYQRGDQGLVRLATYAGAPSEAIKSRAAGVPVITTVTAGWLVDRMTREIAWTKWDSRVKELVAKDAPTKVASGLLDRGGEWRCPFLAGFCGAPLLDLCGRLISSPGYDERTGLYLVDPPALEPIGTTNRHRAEWAGERLGELLGIGLGQEPERFPFVGPVDQSAALAMVMTALLRPVLPTAPICAVSAATPGTGKSLWVDVCSIVMSGRTATVVNLGKDEEETEKRIAAQLILGESFSFDNIEGAFRSSALCTAATQEGMNVRILSQSKMARVLTRVLIWLTGNNVTPLGDLARRVLLARMDAGCERPELREFETDALERARENRAAAIHAALTLTAAYLAAEEPKVEAPPTGSFRQWDRMVRYPLIWAGYPDPLGRAEDLRDGDHSVSGMGLFMQAWRRVRPEPCTAAAIYELIVETSPQMGGGSEPTHPDLHGAAIEVRGDPRKWTSRELGYLLREVQGRPIGGLRVVRIGKSKMGVLWAVESVA